MTLRVVELLVSGVVIFVSGFFLTYGGRPYGTTLLNIHKLVALAAIVVIGIAAYQSNHTQALSSAQWTFLVLAAALLVTLFATGGVVSAKRDGPRWVLWLHRLAPYPAVLFTVLGAFSLVGV